MVTFVRLNVVATQGSIMFSNAAWKCTVAWILVDTFCETVIFLPVQRSMVFIEHGLASERRVR